MLKEWQVKMASSCSVLHVHNYADPQNTMVEFSARSLLVTHCSQRTSEVYVKGWMEYEGKLRGSNSPKTCQKALQCCFAECFWCVCVLQRGI